MFCTLTYANSKGPQWLGSHFRPSVEPESSSAVKWERRSAVWKWISLAEIRGSPQRAMHSLQRGKRTAVQIVFGTLSTCYFISQMENNNTDSGVGTGAARRGDAKGFSALWVCGPPPPCLFFFFFLHTPPNMQSDFRKDFWLVEFGDWQTLHMVINDKAQSWQPAGYWGKSYWISALIPKKIKK